MRLPLACSGALLLLAACGDRQRPAGASPDSSAAAAARVPSPSPSPDTQSVAVQVGGQEEEVDACSMGAIRVGARMVAVRSGPGERFPAVDSLPSGASFHSCDGSKEGWTGIVYRRKSDPPDTTGSCGGLASPIPAGRAYRGPCRSGWVPSAEREVTAG